MMTFTEAELHTIKGALLVAAETYDRDAEVMASASTEAAARMAQQFDAQARKARQLAWDIERRA